MANFFSLDRNGHGRLRTLNVTTFGSGWKKVVLKIIEDKIVRNDFDTKVLIIISGHLQNHEMETACIEKLYEEKTSNLRINIKRYNYFRDTKDIIRFINGGRYRIVVTAFCHPMFSNLETELFCSQRLYPYILVSHQDMNCPRCKIDAKKCGCGRNCG